MARPKGSSISDLDKLRKQREGWHRTQTETRDQIDEILKTEGNLDKRLKAWECSKEVGKGLKETLVNLRGLRNKTVQGLKRNTSTNLRAPYSTSPTAMRKHGASINLSHGWQEQAFAAQAMR